MANTEYNEIIKALSAVMEQADNFSQMGKQRAYNRARSILCGSELPEAERAALLKLLSEAANSSGWNYDSNGIAALIQHLEVQEKPSTETKGFTLANLFKLTNDGKVFSVEFIKRSTGELRKMRCRLGVKKHLKGGTKVYDPSDKQLLTVFDMDAQGYRSVPVEGIQRLSVGGQHFTIH